jgi:hypothetical protein
MPWHQGHDFGLRFKMLPNSTKPAWNFPSVTTMHNAIPQQVELFAFDLGQAQNTDTGMPNLAQRLCIAYVVAEDSLQDPRAPSV